MILSANAKDFALNTKPPRGRSPYAITDSERTSRLDNYFFARDAVVLAGGIQKEQLVESASSQVTMVFKAKNNVLSVANLEKIHALEKQLGAENDEYLAVCLRCPNATDYTPAANRSATCGNGVCDPSVNPLLRETCTSCPTDCCAGCEASIANPSPRKCQPIFSAVDFYYPSSPGVPDGNGALVADVDSVTESFRDVLARPASPLSFFFGKDLDISSSTLKTTTIRSRFRTGLPLRGFVSSQIDSTKQEAIADKYIVKLHTEVLLPTLKEWEGTDLELLYMGAVGLAEEWILELLGADATFALGSFMFVFGFIWFHTSSLFIAASGMLHILLSLPISIVLVTNVFGVKYFDFLNMFMLFIILGVGADDIFVYFDAWKQSAHAGEAVNKSMAHRVSWVFHRASKAMFVTSFTTGVAFLANATSPLMPVRGFGYFAFLLILTNYLFVISWFPCMILIYHFHIRKVNAVCQRVAGVEDPLDERNDHCCTCCCFSACHSKTIKRKAVETSYDGWKEEHSPSDEQISHEGKMTVFLISKFFPWLVRARFAVFGILSLWVALCVGLSTQLEEDTTAGNFLPPDHPIQRWQVSMQYDFPTSFQETLVEAHMVFGLDKYPDRTGFSDFDFQSEKCNNGPCGAVVYDSTFDFGSPESQEHILSICDAIPEISCARAEVSCVI